MEIIYSSIKDIEGLYKAIADESRLKIVFMLVELNEACVRDIQLVLRVPQPTVSRHLGYLKRMGLVDNHRKGKWNYYFIVKQLPDVVKRHVQILKMDPAYRKIFTQEMQPLMDKLQSRPKGRR
jgi:ArsR family transcriptional regulator